MDKEIIAQMGADEKTKSVIICEDASFILICGNLCIK